MLNQPFNISRGKAESETLRTGITWGRDHPEAGAVHGAESHRLCVVLVLYCRLLAGDEYIFTDVLMLCSLCCHILYSVALLLCIFTE